ncbi:MAG: hypothetical protein JSS91_07835 [Bacteroidetes bacterium]|nr:hypothetical protein [Bacteroidota bacterium]
MQFSKKYKIYIILSILPVLLILSGSILKNSLGEYYLNLYDPAYVYLINSLNLAQMSGYGVGHIDHPGTPVQVTGSVILIIYHFLSHTSLDIVDDVFNRPEQYLFILNKGFILIVAAALFTLGLLVFKFAGNILISILFQLSPFISNVILYGMVDVSPDNFLILSSLLFSAMLIIYLYKDREVSELSFKIILLISIISGFGLATKLNFIPVLFIPLILISKIRLKLTYVFFTLIFFFIFVFPAIENYQYFVGWIKNLFIHNGIYGTGADNIVNFPQFFRNIVKIITINYFFGIIYFFSISTLIYYYLKWNKTNSSVNTFKPLIEVRVLTALLISFTIQIIIVAKHYHPYSQKYMIPSLMLSLTALFVCIRIHFYFFKNRRENLIYLIMIILLLIWNATQFYSLNQYLRFQKLESTVIEDYIKDNYSQNFIISDLESSDYEKSMAFNIFYSGSQTDKYMNLLSEKFTSNIFYSGWADQFIYISDTVKIRNNILKEEKIIIQLSKFASIDKVRAKLIELCKADNIFIDKKIENNNGESVYEAYIFK